MKNIRDSLKQIRGSTRVALPADDMYIFSLGVALYGFASVANFMTEVVQYFDLTDTDIRGRLQSKTAGEILDGFRQAAKKIKPTETIAYGHSTIAANLFESLNTRRNDIIHSYPITNSKNEQILLRYHSPKNKNFEVDSAFLASFNGDLSKVSDELYEVRTILRPKV